MAGGPRPKGAAPRLRRSKTVWPWIFGVLVVVVLLVLLGWGLGWWDAEAVGDLPAD